MAPRTEILTVPCHALILLACGDFNIDNDAGYVVNSGVLLVSRFETTIAAVRCHRGVGISYTDLLALAALSAVAELLVVGDNDRLDVADSQRIPADMRADK